MAVSLVERQQPTGVGGTETALDFCKCPGNHPLYRHGRSRVSWVHGNRTGTIRSVGSAAPQPGTATYAG